MTEPAPRTADRTETEIIAELDEWLQENWDPDITVAEWWQRLGLSGWGAPMWPEEWYGKNLNRHESVAVQNRISGFGALPAPGGLGLLLAGPTIIDHGTDEQKRTLVKNIITGQQSWCQLFSEPGAGSDLAGLQTKAVKDGDEWVVNGQKVWTSTGHTADMGMLIARTDPDQPKHAGITYFAIDMHQDGMDVRPLRELTGRALFNEVFMSDVRCPDKWVIGEVNNGWRVANTTLMHERSGLGAGGGSAAASLAAPGTVSGDLDRRVGDFVRDPDVRRANGGGTLMGHGGARGIIELAKASGKIEDRTVRQDLMRLHTLHELARMNNLRAKAARAAKKDIPGLPNIMKLSMSEILRVNRDTSMRILGPAATLHGYDQESSKHIADATGNRFLPMITEMALFSPAPAIYGGTDQIQKNIIGERVLGLPKEPNQDKVLAFKDLLKNG